MSNESISKFMLRDHARVEASLNKLKNGLIGDFKALLDYYRDFKWEVERHFFFEEKVIFSNLRMDAEMSFAFNHILKDHEIVLRYLRDIEHSIQKEEILPDLSKLLVLLKEHKNFEDDTVYPKLDAEISDGEKESIIRRLKM